MINKLAITIFLIINVSVIASPYTFSQQAKFSIKIKNANIVQALNIIQDQSDYTFLYNNEKVDKVKPVDINIVNAGIEEVLSETLKNTGLTFKLIDKTIIILPKQESGKSNSELLNKMSEKWTITGTVFDDAGFTIPGVNVFIRSTNQGVATDSEGKFSIEVEGESVILIFSYIGYKDQEIEVFRNKPEIIVNMQNEAELIDEVLVVAYSEQSKASFTGSAEAVNLEEMKTAPRESFQQNLQGNISGVFLQSASGQPGSLPEIRIRGISSVNGSNSPLYVVDGMPISKYDITNLATSSNTMAGINPDDIETITVLKDASATALYGSRGANGVILITTKRGKKGRTIFNFKTSHGFSEIIWLDRNMPLRTPEMIELLTEARMNNGETKEEAENFLFEDPNGPGIDKKIDTDWFNELTRKGSFNKYSLSASGGNDNTSFYSSLSYHDQIGTIIGVDYKKFNANLGIRNNISDKLVIDMGISLNNQVLHTASDGGLAANPMRVLTRIQPWYSIYNEDGTYNTSYFSTYNPIGIVNENIRETNMYGVLGNIGLKYFLFKGFRFETKGNVDFKIGDEFRYDNPDFGYGRNYGGMGRKWINRVFSWNWTNLLRYNFDINRTHLFEIFGGHEAQKVTKSYFYAKATQYASKDLTALSNASVPMDASSKEYGSSIESWLLSANYNFSEKYFLNLSARRDGSSRFGNSVKWANFGSVGIAWNIKKEPLFKNIKLVNSLKLRSSYGITGNQDGIGDYESRGLYSTGSNYNGNPGIIYSQQENGLLTWEKNIPFNVGLDFEIYNRFSGTIEYYYRKTNDLLLNMQISMTNGISDYAANVGEMKNSGWEFSFYSHNIKKENFNWYTNFNISTNKNEVTSLPNGPLLVTDDPDQVFALVEEGYSFYSFFLPAYAGVNPDDGNALWYIDSTKTETTTNYSEAQWFYQGSPLPKFFGGITNTLNYKGITLSFLLYYQFGNVIYDTYGKYVNSDGSAGADEKGKMSRYIYDNRWQNPGDITDVPKVVWGNSQSGLGTQNSTRLLYDGSYIRLRDITLSYILPQKWLELVRIKSANIYFRGSNMWTWTKDKTLQIDPEVGLNGISDLRIPASKQWVFGLDISF